MPRAKARIPSSALADEDNTELRIRGAALHLFSTKGFEATGIRDIARDAGVTTAALYHYMGTKSDLLFGLVHDGMTRLISNSREVLRGSGSAVEEVVALMTCHVTFHTREPLLARVIDTQYNCLTDDCRAEVQSLRDEYDELWQKAVLHGQETLEFNVREPSMARLALLEMGNGVAHWYRPTGCLSSGEIAEEMSLLALGLLGWKSEGLPRVPATLDRSLDDRRPPNRSLELSARHPIASGHRIGRGAKQRKGHVK